MEDDAPVIYGLEFQARALTPQTAETDAIRFLVGTQSLKYDNQIHIIDFDDENNIINKNVLLHQAGEIWHISASPADKGVLATCYNKTTDGKVVTCAAVWRMPAELEPGGHESPEDAASPAHALELLCHLGPAAHGSTACVAWEPAGDGKRVISLADNHILLWDLQESSSQAVLASSASLEGKGQLKFTTGRWSPHHNCTQVATANDTAVRGWDTRTMRVWGVRYNHSHDQLVLTGSSDSRVILSNMVSISSEPFGHLVDDDDLSEQEERCQGGDLGPRPGPAPLHCFPRDAGRRAGNLADCSHGFTILAGSQEPPQDSVIATYEEHEDSVYAVDWSSADPWLFASLSYDGRLVINRVPRALKYHILL
ncbi:EARP and GARP complex-interacting protein 1 isoform X4 [Orcinus orca]|uniref:EARP and GARP complex-interacting protein 1 isoform X4 n=1 Tax=Orcinus orca TaxID=9733 RepID=UPI0014415D08|nr:EARP and GARP complex-interacting protein 1 isoform X4 [Orcinus orca]